MPAFWTPALSECATALCSFLRPAAHPCEVDRLPGRQPVPPLQTTGTRRLGSEAGRRRVRAVVPLYQGRASRAASCDQALAQCCHLSQFSQCCAWSGVTETPENTRHTGDARLGFLRTFRCPDPKAGSLPSRELWSQLLGTQNPRVPWCLSQVGSGCEQQKAMLQGTEAASRARPWRVTCWGT